MSRDLLPWFVNDTLSAAERDTVRRELATSAEARADLELWRAVAAEVERSRSEPDGVEIGWRRMARSLERSPARASLRPWQWATAAALVAMLATQTVYLVRQQSSLDSAIRQLGAASDLVRAEEWRVQVRFRASATAEQINALLWDLDARVVAGPSALGVYELAVPRSERFVDAGSLAQWLSEQPIVEQGSAPP